MKFGNGIARSYLASLLAAWIGCWSPYAYTADPLPVFVSILPQKYFVERIGGQRVQVSVMVRQGQSPETYEPTPRQMAKLAQAKLYFRIGIPFENIWLERMIAANPKMEVVDCRQGISLLPVMQNHSILEAGDHHGMADPHIWTSPPLVKIMAAHIRNALIAVKPVFSSQFEKNYQAFIQDLNQLDQYIRQTLAGITHRHFMVFHPAWSYFARTYGLEEIPIEQAGKEPGAKSLAALIERGRQEGFRAIFVQKQSSRSNAELVARAIGAKVIVLDPLAEDYGRNLRHVASVLAKVLR
ncbi:metal ABC transporter solute-binding protein, Zn/Mn family [Nitrosococcus watsonii]|uniref:High-affinity zinc uptake system protein ZnuA n=1 Tax=Nitrosococcus watsoni (strain C-113) TaxID=105559 RepID=D8KBQ9_NITWC|nr:zinc ABC transporter substrate-binding protein [Nitrosococcus watsonii]ADJ27670.1 periplasmic solute binding protein [Nitrosococcus watsonii C-113]